MQAPASASARQGGPGALLPGVKPFLSIFLAFGPLDSPVIYGARHRATGGYAKFLECECPSYT